MTTPADTAQARFTLVDADRVDESEEFADAVRAGLTGFPKRLPCRYLYDRSGSLLFEEICRLPEYYLTRAEQQILSERAEEIAERLSNGRMLIELGSGSTVKTRILIEALLRRHETLRYIPVDVSREILEENSAKLLESFPGLQITAFAGEYRQGLQFMRAEVEEPKCILWLGSSLGNLGRVEAGKFLRDIRDTMLTEDRLLVGIDMRKDRAVLERAYNDSRGITARFTRNILVRMNRELGGRFDLDKFRHRALYNEEAGRVEIHLVSTEAQEVRIERLGLKVSFAANEPIHTENSYKYSVAEIEQLAHDGNLRTQRQWFDAKNRFSVNLFAPLPREMAEPTQIESRARKKDRAARMKATTPAVPESPHKEVYHGESTNDSVG